MHFPYPCGSKLFLSCPVPQSYCMVFIVFNRCEIGTLTFLESKCIKLEKQRKKQISKTYFEQKTRYTIKCSRSGQCTNVKIDRVKSQTIFYRSRIGHQSETAPSLCSPSIIILVNPMRSITSLKQFQVAARSFTIKYGVQCSDQGLSSLFKRELK